MTRVRFVAPTRAESVLAGCLLCLSVVELLFSDEQPPPDPIRVISAVVPPVLVAFSRSAPRLASTGMMGVLVVTAVQPSTSGTLGTGFAWMTLVFALGAWVARPWPWVCSMLLVVALSDLRAVDRDAADLLIDLALLGLAFTAGRLVHRRTRHGEQLSSRLKLAEEDLEDRAREAVARERALIARELHDIVAHSVSLMVVQAGTARPIADRVDHELADVLENIERSGREALAELRRLLGVLHVDQETDLQPTPDLNRLDQLFEGVRRAGLEVRATVDVPGTVPPGVALCAYRTVQEGLTNALRYTDGSTVEVTVTGDAQWLTVRVQDSGIPPDDELTSSGAGAGLVGLRERVLLCGGHLRTGPSLSGHLLEVALPLTGPPVTTQVGPA